jgi:hypothetical protein
MTVPQIEMDAWTRSQTDVLMLMLRSMGRVDGVCKQIGQVFIGKVSSG